jgi:hypothetical protein
MTDNEAGANLPAEQKKSPGTLEIFSKNEAENAFATAQQVTGPRLASALVETSLVKKLLGLEIDLTETRRALKESSDKINAGDLSDVESMLFSQASALNLMFAEMNRRALNNLYDVLTFESGKAYMGLALKAQAQSRATLEALGNIKNGPMIYARQANVNNGGQQQINNAASSRAQEKEIQPSKVLEQSHEQLQRMDTGSPVGASQGDSTLATVGEGDGAKDG